MPSPLRSLTALLFIFLLALPVAAADKDVRYVGSRKSDKYHALKCRFVKSVYPENIIYYDTARDALKAGYEPCKVCKPPKR